MGAAVPKGLLDLPRLERGLLLVSMTRGCSYLLAAAKYRSAGQFFSDCWLRCLGFSAFFLECFWARLSCLCCAAQASRDADLPPANLVLCLAFTARSSAVSLLQPRVLHCCHIQPVLPSPPPMAMESCFPFGKFTDFTYRSNYLSFFL